MGGVETLARAGRGRQRGTTGNAMCRVQGPPTPTLSADCRGSTVLVFVELIHAIEWQKIKADKLSSLSLLCSVFRLINPNQTW